MIKTVFNLGIVEVSGRVIQVTCNTWDELTKTVYEHPRPVFGIHIFPQTVEADSFEALNKPAVEPILAPKEEVTNE